MHARMVRARVTPGRLDEAVDLWKSEVGPNVREQAGFVSARLLIDRTTDEIQTLVVFQSAEDVARSVSWNRGLVGKFGELFAEPPKIDEGFELVVEVMAEE